MDKNDKLLLEIRERFDIAEKAASANHDAMLDDLQFLEGKQWPDDLQKDREADGRPCLVIDKTSVFVDQVIGDIRQNEPSIKVKPVDGDSDPDVAEIMTGLIRNIEAQSNAEVAYDTAAENAIACGQGIFRIVTEYCDDETFDQEIRIKRCKNQFAAIWDPNSQEADRSDADYCFVTERMPKDEFEKKHPGKDVFDFNNSKERNIQWADKTTVRVAEYWRREVDKKSLYLLESPFTGEQVQSDTKEPGWKVIKERKIEKGKLVWYKTNGRDILEGPIEWPGKYIPVCMVYGKELNIEGRTVYRGVVRKAKDPQRLYNYSRSHSAEVTSLAPKMPFLATAKMIGNYQSIWDVSHKKSFPFLPFNVDPDLPAFPQRAAPISQSTAVMSEIQIADQELHDTTGLQAANLGQKSNEQSGRAILARQREGDTANYVYYDNLARAIRYCGKVLVDLIPKIYDTARMVRILGEDGSDRQVPVNQPVQVQQPDGSVMERVFDLQMGKYDVVVSVGPSFATQRDEAAASMLEFLKIVPNAGPLVADLLAKNMDWPGAEQISQRLAFLLPPQLGGPAPVPPPDQGPPPDPFAELDGQKKQVEIEGMLLDNRQKSVDLARKETGVDDAREDARMQAGAAKRANRR